MKTRSVARRGRALLATVVLGLLPRIIAAQTPPSDPRPSGDPTRTTFAAELGVDLATMRRLPSGVYVRDIEAGAGATAAPGKEVTIGYVAYLADGKEVDRSVAGETPVRFRIGSRDVIRGWDLGLRGMRAGGTRLLVVPSRLAYGAEGTDRVPPHAVMVFVIALDSVR